MAPPDISSSTPPLTPTDSEPTHPCLQYNSLKRNMFSKKLKEDSILLPPPNHQEIEELHDSSVESTEVTIETNVDPASDSTTTTTTVHLPFQLTRQCDPPKVISWMKVQDPKRTRSSKQDRRHHPHQRPEKSPTLLHSIFPFLKKEETSSSQSSRKRKKEPKKNDTSFVTLFSIRVSVLGKVHVPPPVSSLDQSKDKGSPADLEPKRIIPAQLDLSETTSYVIHRTFDDFEHLSEMVLRLEDILQTSSNHHHQQSSPASSMPQSEEAPTLTALKVHHPYPSLYQTLLKQFSSVKANQRAFNASATTHGFNEGGAFERILELDQYLENVWYWLLPEHTPQQLDLSVEQHEIMQWFMPSPKSAQADGRQMKDRKDNDSKWQDLQRQYGPKSRQQKQKEEQTTDSEVTQTTVTSSHQDGDNDQTDLKKSDLESSMPSVASSASSSSSMRISSDGGRNGQDHNNNDNDNNNNTVVDDDDNINGSSSSDNNDDSNNNNTVVDDNDNSNGGSSSDNNDDNSNNDNNINNNTPDGLMTNSRRTSSTIISSPVADSFLKELHNDATSDYNEFKEIPVNSTESGSQGGGVGGVRVEVGSPASDVNNNNNNNNDDDDDSKLSRRISLSHVLRSLSSSKSLRSRHRLSMHEIAKKRSSTMLVSAPIQEIAVWNSVTTKRHSGHHQSEASTPSSAI